MWENILAAKLVVSTCLLASWTVSAQQAPAQGVYIIFDGSGSMWGQLADKVHKITAARSVLKEFVSGDFGAKQLALRVYGHRRKGDCSDTELVVPFAPSRSSAGRMQKFVDKINPRGKTPISRSLRAALEDFGDRQGEIILISDGIETCDEDPCELVRDWVKKNVEIKVHVVGLGLNAREEKGMRCISDAAGTQYQNAGSAAELADGLAKIKQSSGSIALIIRATTAAGELMVVKGFARPKSGDPVPVGSHRRNVLVPGEYQLEVGVNTRNGQAYLPVTQTVRVSETGETVMRVVVKEPPSVQARFTEEGKKVRGSLITAYQGGKKAFSFRPRDRAYVSPGTYEFRTRPNRENELRLTESLADGEHKELHFEMIHTVHARIKMVASDSGLDFRQNYELWQDRGKKYGVHWSNGVRALPGTYDLHLPDRLTPYVRRGLVLSEKDSQDFKIEVPVGHVTVRYLKTDGSPQKDERCWVSRLEGDKSVGGKLKQSGRKVPLLPGRYQLKGWDRLGDFDLLNFEIAVGDDKEVVLRSKR